MNEKGRDGLLLVINYQSVNPLSNLIIVILYYVKIIKIIINT